MIEKNRENHTKTSKVESSCLETQCPCWALAFSCDYLCSKGWARVLLCQCAMFCELVCRCAMFCELECCCADVPCSVSSEHFIALCPAAAAAACDLWPPPPCEEWGFVSSHQHPKYTGYQRQTWLCKTIKNNNNWKLKLERKKQPHLKTMIKLLTTHVQMKQGTIKGQFRYAPFSHYYRGSIDFNCQYLSHWRDEFLGIHWQQGWYWMSWSSEIIISNTLPAP